MNNKLLGIYLNDHLAGATGGLELCKRAAKSNEDNGFGAQLQTLAEEIETDKDALQKFMDDLGVPEDVFKRQAAVIAERAGRLKLNGQLTGYSPLSRLVELEGLKLGVTGKLSLWRSLEHLGGTLPLEQSELPPLIKRAEDQLARIEQMRLEAAALAIGAPEETSSR